MMSLLNSLRLCGIALLLLLGEACTENGCVEQSCFHGDWDSVGCRCDCDGGWAGEACNECNLECQNNGVLDSENCECECQDFWGGLDCSTPANNYEISYQYYEYNNGVGELVDAFFRHTVLNYEYDVHDAGAVWRANEIASIWDDNIITHVELIWNEPLGEGQYIQNEDVVQIECNWYWPPTDTSFSVTGFAHVTNFIEETKFFRLDGGVFSFPTPGGASDSLRIEDLTIIHAIPE